MAEEDARAPVCAPGARDLCVAGCDMAAADFVGVGSVEGGFDMQH